MNTFFPLNRLIILFQAVILSVFCSGNTFSQDTGLRPGSIFREYSYNKMISPYLGVREWKDSFYVDMEIADMDGAIDAEIAIKYWGGHSGTSDQTFRVNNSRKIDFPQPLTPGNPYCYYRTVIGNPPVKIPVNALQNGANRFTFFCGPQVCYNFNWPHYWVYSFTVRVYYDNSKSCVRGKILKTRETDTAVNLVGFRTDVDDPAMVESVEYIGYYRDYDLDGDGNPAGWHYTISNGQWEGIIGRQTVADYFASWNNFWVPVQDGPIKIMAKINSKNGLSYLTQPVVFNKLIQKGSMVKMYNTLNLDENFGVRIGRKKECIIKVNDDISKAISAYLVLSVWSGESDDGKIHALGINGKILAECPGKLHDWAFLKIPVPVEWLKTGDNIFFIYSETEGHALEVNYPGPSILIRFPGTN